MPKRQLPTFLGALLVACSGAVVDGSAGQQVAVSVEPATAQVKPGGSVPFAAAVTGSVDTRVTWTVDEAAGGTVDSSGSYTAPSTTGLYHVRAASRADPSAQGVASVTVTSNPIVAVSVSPSSASVPLGGATSFLAVVTGSTDTAVTWAVQEASGCGSVTQAGSYTAPTTAGTCHVVATSHADPSKQAVATVQVIWALLPVTRVRVVPAPGQEAAMVGGTIQGSNVGPTSGTVLYTFTSAPASNPAYTDIPFSNATPYRWIKYYGPPGSYGDVAEIEFYSGNQHLTGSGFGTAGSRSGNPWQNALDGNPATYFDGPTANDVYVGIDAASANLVSPATFSPAAGSYSSSQVVTISTTTPGATILYTTDGSDPSTSATALTYSSPVRVSSTETLSAHVSAPGYYGLTSQATYQISGSTQVLSLMSIGNSLTDRLYPYFEPIATLGGQTLSSFLYSEPGAGTYVYQNDPTGFLVLPSGAFTNVQTFVRGRPFDHVTMQPYPNMPCVPSGYWAANSDAGQRSDAANILDVWNDAYAQNPNVQLWVYWQWPKPATLANGQQPPSWQNCFTGGWNRDPTIWNVTTPAATWDAAIDDERQYQEAVRAALLAQAPNRPPPYIIPGGLVMKNLEAAVLAGTFPGLAATENAFLNAFFASGGTDDHPSQPNGEWALALTFYACIFKADPRGLPVPSGFGITWTTAQANFIEQVVYDTVNGYSLSGFHR